jgi:diguanylate cyclase (GGDEF)-like protein/PAS domain S-box-containing protein
MSTQISHIPVPETSTRISVEPFEASVPWTLLDELFEGVFVVDAELRIESWSSGAEELAGYTRETVLGRPCNEAVPMYETAGDVDLLSPSLGSAIPATGNLSDSGSREYRCVVRHAEGHWLQVRARTVPLPDNARPAGRMAIAFSDSLAVVSLRQHLQALRHLALSDPLTELGNRRYGMMSLKVRLDEMKRYGWPCGVVFLDLDQFKQVNDRFGHDVGDQTLKSVAKSLSRHLRPFDVVCRWGGEEFMVIVANIQLPELERLANELRLLLQRSSVRIGQKRISVTASIGATVAQRNDTEETLIARADRLMYGCKRLGRNRVLVE